MQIYKVPVIIIRKKIEGENSIEELARNISKFTGAQIVECPFHSTSIRYLILNIKYFRKILAPVYHIITPSEAYLLPFLRNAKKRRVITYHDLGTIRAGRNLIYSFERKLQHLVPSLFFADYITFVSNNTKNEFINYFHLSKDKKQIQKMNVIYNAYHRELVPSERKKGGKFTILQIGTGKRKNLEGTINACKGLDIQLNIIGKLSSKHIKMLEQFGIDYSNAFDVSFNEIINAYRNCDLVSFPTFYEGFGMPIIEANVMQRPIISSKLPVIEEVGRDAVYYVDPYNISSIRQAILNIQDSAELRDKLVYKGIINAQRFKPIEVFSNYNKIYKCIQKNVAQEQYFEGGDW